MKAEKTSVFGNPGSMSAYEYVKSLSVELAPEMGTGYSSVGKGDHHVWYLPELQTFLKAQYVTEGFKWQDYICEKLATDLCFQLGIACIDAVPCVITDDLEYVRNPWAVAGCKFSSFLEENECLISFRQLWLKAIALYGAPPEEVYEDLSTSERIQSAIGVYRAVCGLNATNYICDIILVDFLICNENRNFDNFGVIYNPVTEVYRFPPLYDNGLSLFEGHHKFTGQRLKTRYEMISGGPFSASLTHAFSSSLEFRERHYKPTINLEGFMFPRSSAQEYLKRALKHASIKYTGAGRYLTSP